MMRDGLFEVGAEQEQYLKECLQEVESKVHAPEEFVSGSFKRHLPVWEELVRDSSRPS
jgi:hypothetical protein